MGTLPRWLRGSCCRSCLPEEAVPCVLRCDQAGVPSQSMPLLLSHCRASLDRPGAGDGLTSRPVIRTPPFAPIWTALSSPCSRMRRSKFGGHLITMRRPQVGHTHSSAPDSVRSARTMSWCSGTVRHHPVSRAPAPTAFRNASYPYVWNLPDLGGSNCVMPIKGQSYT